MTVSLRADERDKIKELMKKHGLKQHEVVKLAIRHFLFPGESEHWVDGRKAVVEELKVPCFPELAARVKANGAACLGTQELADSVHSERRITIVPNKEKPFITIVKETEEEKRKAEIKKKVDELLRKDGLIS